MSPPSTCESVSGDTKRARVIVSSIGVPARSKTIVTCEPSGPRTRSATSAVVSLVTSSPLTLMILSPFCTPARSAGVFGMTSMTSIGCCGSAWLIVTPMPETGDGGLLKVLARSGSR